MTDTPSIDVNSATREEMLAFAKDSLGLNPNNRIGKADLQHLIAQHIGTTVDSGGNDAEAEAGPEVKKNKAALDAQKRVRIRIHEHPDHPAKVSVMVNGVGYWIKTGAVVSVPESVVEALRNAVQHKPMMVEDDSSLLGMRAVVKQGHAYPFEVLPDLAHAA